MQADFVCVRYAVAAFFGLMTEDCGRWLPGITSRSRDVSERDVI